MIHSLWLWRWLPHKLSKRQSLHVLFRTTFTRTIKLNLLIVVYIAYRLLERGCPFDWSCSGIGMLGKIGTNPFQKRFLGATGIPQTAECCMSAGVANTPSAILSYVSMWKFLRTREKCQRTTSRQFSSVVYSMYPYIGRRSIECFIKITFASRTSLYFCLVNMK